MQTLPDGSHWLIFSVWDKGNAETDAGHVRRVHHDYAGEGVKIARFGGEGTGGRAMAEWPWELGKTVRFAVSSAAVEDGKTAYTGWIWDDRRAAWFRIATFVSAVNSTPGRLTGCYSFVEDFLRNGESRLHARGRASAWCGATTGRAGARPQRQASAATAIRSRRSTARRCRGRLN